MEKMYVSNELLKAIATNNWRRNHGYPSKRKVTKRKKKIIMRMTDDITAVLLKMVDIDDLNNFVEKVGRRCRKQL